jgi:hippurate hydrolase
MPVHNRIADLLPDMTAWRRDFHAHPELGFEEHRTSAIVAEKLAGWGIEVHRGIAGTGVVGVLRNGTSGRSIGLRADMDCLPMTETTGLPHASTTEGRMHACGHDGHTATLLGAAQYLAESRNFDGTVHFLFQPAEEGGGGGRVMVEEGLFDRFPCDSVFALHNDPALKVGQASVVAGTVLAASDRFWITIGGLGGHASRPHQCVDPLFVGAQIVVALQSLVSRAVDPLRSAVVSVTQFIAGSAMNVIPETAELRGTVRTLLPEERDLIEAGMARVVEGVAAAHGASATLRYERGYPPTVNDAERTERAALAAARVLGEPGVIRERPPLMGAEDFSYMLLARPGCFVRLGQAGAAMGGISVHNPKYDFNDDILPLGASFFASIVEQELPRE